MKCRLKQSAQTFPIMSNSHLTHYIRECVKAYETAFPEDWIEHLSWNNKRDAFASYRTGQDTISSFQERCFVEIGKSLLSGEYIVSRSDFDEAKITLEKYWTQEHICPNPNVDEDIRQFQNRLYGFYEALDSHLRALFYAYTYLVVSVEEKMEYVKHDYLFKVDTLVPNITRDFVRFGVLRDIIIPICELEHRLDRDSSVIQKATEYREQLSLMLSFETSEDCKEVFRLAISKINFVLMKLLGHDESFDILIDCQKRKVSRASIPSFPDEMKGLFSSFQNIHESKPYEDDEIAQIQLRLSQRQGSFCDIALLINYYCTNNKSLKQIDNLIDQFNERYRALSHKGYHSNFDNHALDTLRNFIYNCRLSFRINSKDYSIENLKEDIETIEIIQQETLIRNFFPYLKGATFISSFLKRKIEQRDTAYNYQEGLELLESYIHKLNDSLDWCELHKFYPVQLPFKECKVSFDGFKIFLPSSVTRPINYIRQREAVSQLVADLESHKTSLIYLKDREEMDRLRQTLNDTEKRYLQIGSILIGVVTFLFGTINIFTQSNASGHDMFVSVLGLGTMLVIFAIVMLIIVDNIGLSTKNKKRTWLWGVILLAYTDLSVWYAFHPNLFDSNGNTNQKPEQTTLVETPSEHQVVNESKK